MNETIKGLVEQLNNNDRDLNQLYDIHSQLADASNVDKNDACIVTVEHYLNHDEMFDVAMAFALRAYHNYARIEALVLVNEKLYNNNRLMLSYLLSCLCLFTKKFPECNRYIYDYRRYEVHAMICMSIGKFEEANSNIELALDYPQEDMPEYKSMIADCKKIFEDSASKMK